jgi:uncharacterized membrane protein
MACTFSSLISPAGSAPAALASLLSTLRRHKSLEKHCVSPLSYLFAHLDLLSSDSFSSTLLSSNLSLLSSSSLLCFSSVHIVGSLTSKLPSIIYYIICVCAYMTCTTSSIQCSLKRPTGHPSTRAHGSLGCKLASHFVLNHLLRNLSAAISYNNSIPCIISICLCMCRSIY